MRRPSFRYQRTLLRPAEVQGIGYLTGADIRLRFVPAPPATGLVFVRTDLGPQAAIPATFSRVTGTHRRTTLGVAPLCVQMVEHVLAALAGMRVDNCIIELDAPEPPGLDGSALAFVKALQDAGTKLQPVQRPVWIASSPMVLHCHGATLAIHPDESEQLRVSYLLDYGLHSPIGRQSASLIVTPESFINELAPCRTFLLEEEALALRDQGVGARTQVTDLLVFGPSGPISNQLRFGNEPARHKILDIIGDLALIGQDLRGHVVAYRSGHPLNVDLVRAIHARMPQARAEMRRAA